MADYQALIDAQTWAFIERTNSFYPPETVGLPVSGQRNVYNRMCEAFNAGRPGNVSTRDTFVPATGRHVALRIYEREGGNPPATIVYFHGGGFVVGGLESHDDVCAELCSRTGFRVVSVDYRLCPEHLHPAAFDDAIDAVRWAIGLYEHRVIVCGDSAGGNLAAAVCGALRAETAIAGQVLIYPGLGGDRTKGSYLEHAHAPMLTLEEVNAYATLRTGGNESSGDPTAAPLADKDFSGLPPTVVFSAECDPLCDDGRDYRDALRAAGVVAELHVESGLVHGYLRARHTVDRASDSFDRIVESLKAMGGGGAVHSAAQHPA